jgi:predicted helicase
VIKRLNWSIATVSSDGIRKEEIDKLCAKDPKLERSVAFEKTAKSATAEFFKRLTKLIKECDKTFSNVHIVFIDKNHPINAVDKTKTLIKQNLPPQGVHAKLLYMVPEINDPERQYPFSARFLL